MTRPTTVTPVKNTTVTMSSMRTPANPAETPRISVASTAQIAPKSHVLGPSATTQ